MNGWNGFAKAGPVQRDLYALLILGGISASLYVVIALVSWQFAYHAPLPERPLLLVLGLFGINFLLYLWAIRLAWRLPDSRALLGVILGPAIVFRLVLLFSLPIQEIDIYRYLWDGAVTANGISPFRYSPEQVRISNGNTSDEALNHLVRLREQHPELDEILHRIHFGELPTVYPPISQVMFALVHLTTPTNTPIYWRVVLMKWWLVGFDLGTCWLMLGLLRWGKLPLGALLLYAWCPLLLKEIANSGHLDSLAIFFTTFSVLLTARLLERTSLGWQGPGVGLSLAAAVGAKLYPIILAPLIGIALLRRFGLLRLIPTAGVFLLGTVLVVWPMLPPPGVAQKTETPLQGAQEPTASGTQPSATDPSLGVQTFLRRWEMNDFLFLLLIENLRPADQILPGRRAWFSVVPESAREFSIQQLQQLVPVNRKEAPFLIARLVSSLAFLMVLGFLVAGTWVDPSRLGESVFLTLAWFWLLCPTQNPWYWLWALPFLPFARHRPWLVLSGLVFLYYLRFWFSYHYGQQPIWGTTYAGVVFFDMVITWVEFGPWLIWLCVSSYLSRRSR